MVTATHDEQSRLSIFGPPCGSPEQANALCGKCLNPESTKENFAHFRHYSCRKLDASATRRHSAPVNLATGSGPAFRGLWFLVLSLAAGMPASSQEAGSPSFGPAKERFRLTLADGMRTETAGPLYYHERSGSRTIEAFPPFFSRMSDPDVDATEVDVLYPLLSWDRFGEEYRFHILQLLSFSGGSSQDDLMTRRFSLFPFYFQQRAANSNDNYTALLPLYGHLKGRLLRDEIHFALFPLWSQTRKRDVVTDNYLYPFFHVRHGERLRGWQFWPLVGTEHRDAFIRTNSLGLEETVGGHDNFFALWPIFLRQDSGIGTTNDVHERAILPLFSSYRSPARDSTTYLWPLYTVTDDREKRYREWGAPWPFVVFARGEGKTANRIWPLFGHLHNEVQTSEFILWPVWKYNRAVADPLDRERTRILFFLYSDLVERNTATSNAMHRVDLWPLFTWKRDLEGGERLQILAPIEPILPNNKSVERNWSHLWSLWRDERNTQTGASSQSLLWNLWRRESRVDFKKSSFLFGLVQYQSSADGARWRWLWLPAKDTRATATPGTK